MDSTVQHRRAANLHNRIAKVGRGVAQLSSPEGLVKRQRGVFGSSDDDDDDDDDGDIFESIFGGHNPAGTTSETTAAATTRAAVTTTAATQQTTAAQTTRPLTTAAETTRPTTTTAATTTAAQTTSRVPVTTSATTTSSSTTSSSTTSQTTSSSTSTSSTSRQPITSHVTTTLADPTTSSRSTAFVTQSSAIASSAGADAAAASTTSKDASGATSSNAGGIAGGVIGGIVGVVALFFVASWFIRRRRRQADEAEWNKQFNDGFNPGNFRKSAMMLPPDNNNSGMFNPRPPTMIERKMSPPAAAYSPYNNAAPVSYNPSMHGGYPSGDYGAQQGYGNEQYGATGGYGQEDQYAQYQQYNNYQAYPAYNNAALSSANPFMDQNAVAYSPAVSPPPANGNYNVVYNERGEPVMQQALTRQPSNGQVLNHNSTEIERQSTVTSASAIGLARSTSQITQIAAASERVGSPPVAGHESLPPLPVPQAMPVAQPAAPVEPVAEPAPAAAAEAVRSPSTKPADLAVSPFADTSLDAKDARMSSMSTGSLGQFPQPPSEVHPPMGSRYKIDSMPPMLPDMQFNSHDSAVPGQDYPSSIHNSMSSFMSPVANEPRPSPLANSTVAEPASPPPVVPKDAIAQAQAAPAAAAPAPATTSPSPRTSANQPKQERPPTVYDEADAYGGI
ncbi:hypothetical protein FB107DRAFT_273147 [Schizophyllum commune]